MSTVCLTMIVKNEAHIVHECLESVCPFIDYWVIVDTGSTDGTQDLIKKFFEGKGVPGEMHERPWVDFGHNRSEALALCDGKADYAWMMDADDRIVGDFKYPNGKNLNADSYLMRIKEKDLFYWRHQILKTGIGWCYKGVVHEYAYHDDNSRTDEKLEGIYHIEYRAMGHRTISVTQIEKYSKDAALLEEALKTDPDNTRYQFFLGQSYRASGQYDKAIAAYRKRAEMGGWEEECYLSLFRIAETELVKGSHFTTVKQKFLEAYEYRPSRAEPLYEISHILMTNGLPHTAHIFAKEAAKIPYPHDDILTVDNSVYSWKALDCLGAASYYARDYRTGYEACARLLYEGHLPKSETDRVRHNYLLHKEKLGL
jgi:glycosyltransferase involved in cell wall biosynthesis